MKKKQPIEEVVTVEEVQQKAEISKITDNFGREDLNRLRDKLNEVIDDRNK